MSQDDSFALMGSDCLNAATEGCLPLVILPFLDFAWSLNETAVTEDEVELQNNNKA